MAVALFSFLNEIAIMMHLPTNKRFTKGYLILDLSSNADTMLSAKPSYPMWSALYQ